MLFLRAFALLVNSAARPKPTADVSGRLSQAFLFYIKNKTLIPPPFPFRPGSSMPHWPSIQGRMYTCSRADRERERARQGEVSGCSSSSALGSAKINRLAHCCQSPSHPFTSIKSVLNCSFIAANCDLPGLPNPTKNHKMLSNMGDRTIPPSLSLHKANPSLSCVALGVCQFTS